MSDKRPSLVLLRSAGPEVVDPLDGDRVHGGQQLLVGRREKDDVRGYLTDRHRRDAVLFAVSVAAFVGFGLLGWLFAWLQ